MLLSIKFWRFLSSTNLIMNKHVFQYLKMLRLMTRCMMGRTLQKKGFHKRLLSAKSCKDQYPFQFFSSDIRNFLFANDGSLMRCFDKFCPFRESQNVKVAIFDLKRCICLTQRPCNIQAIVSKDRNIPKTTEILLWEESYI